MDVTVFPAPVEVSCRVSEPAEVVVVRVKAVPVLTVVPSVPVVEWRPAATTATRTVDDLGELVKG